MKDSVESKLGMFFVLAIIFILLILEFLGGFAFFQRGFHVRAMFKTVHELKIGDPQSERTETQEIERANLGGFAW